MRPFSSWRLPLALTVVGASFFSVPSALADEISVRVALTPDRIDFTADGSATSVRVDPVAPNESFFPLADEGLPALPYRVVHVLLPDGHEFVSARTEHSAPLSMRSAEGLEPAAPQISADDRARVVPASRLAPGDKTRYPQRRHRYLSTGYWHGHAIASFAVFPLAVEGEDLVLYESITLRVITGPGEAPVDVVTPRRARRNTEIRSSVARFVANPAQLGTYPEPTATQPHEGGFQPTEVPSFDGSPVDYVIITVDALADAYQPLADWKTAKGVPTVIRTVEFITANFRNGVDVQETIRNFIREAYEKWGTKWILLGGDTQQITPRYCFTTYYYGGRYIPVDMYFAGLDGTWNEDHDDVWGEANPSSPVDYPDLYPEVYVGRLPTADVTDVAVLTGKIIGYETPVDPEPMDKALILAEVLFPYGWQPPELIETNGADTGEYLYLAHLADKGLRLTRSYETPSLYPGSVQESAGAAIDSMNAGFNHLLHIGHGFRFNMHCADANVTIPDADGLTNGDRLFNIFMLNCTAAAFDFDCLGEHYLRNPNGGAVSVLGSSNSAFPNISTFYMNEYLELTFDQNMVKIGEAYGLSRVPRAPFAELGDNGDFWTQYIYTLLGDPEMPLFTSTVDPLVVAHTDTVPQGLNTIAINVSSNFVPAESVTVCLWKGDEDYQTGLSDASGTLSLDFNAKTAGEITVVATGLNFGRSESTIYVSQSSTAHLVIDTITVEDDSTFASRGNGDGEVDAGEDIRFYPTTRNTGTAASSWGFLKIIVPDSLVDVKDSLAVVEPMAPGEASAPVYPWRIEFDPGIPDQTFIDFSVFIVDSPEEIVGDWNDDFTWVVRAPDLERTVLRIDDSAPLGNGDGIITAGEEFLLYYGVKNYGSGTAVGLTATVADVDGAFTIYQGSDTYPDVPYLTEVENAVGFHLSESSVASENRLEITLTDLYGRAIVDTVELRPPAPPTNMAFNTGLGTDKIQISWLASVSADVDYYRAYRSLTQGGPYTLASLDLVEHATFTDAGLMANTLYYYRLTAVDKSGNESDLSEEGSASTNPPQESGWPNEMADVSANSPSIGDIDGDGDLEVIVGNTFLYAWHHDGQEVRNGDGDVLTWGIFTEAGGDFFGPTGLARIDGNAGLDIMAGSHATLEVFVFDYTGAILPGWPKPTSKKVRAAVVAGDLDGDGMMEVIAVDQDGVLYAWHGDGTEVIDGDNDPLTDGVFRRFPDTPWTHYQTPAVVDIDNDGKDEIFCGTQDAKMYGLDDDGSDLPGWPLTLDSYAAGSPAVGDIDDDGDLEIVLAVKDASQIQARHHDGTLMWIRWFPLNLFFVPSPALADLDGDGKLETIMPSTTTGQSNKIYVIDRFGNNVPGWPVTYAVDSWTESSPVVADVNGDGSPDIMLGDENRNIHGWDGQGNKLDGFPLVIQESVRGTPALGDLDLDGDIEICVAGFDKIVYAWDLPGAYDPDTSPWPMFHANAHRNGQYGFDGVVVSAPAVYFDFDVSTAGLVSLRWTVPAQLGALFDVYRAPLSGDEIGAYVKIGRASVTDSRLKLVDRSAEMGGTYVYKLQPLDAETGAHVTRRVYVPVTRAGVEQNVPNPFNPTTSIVFYVPDSAVPSLGRGAAVSLVVYDISGARVRRLVGGHLPAGRHVREWDGTDDRGTRVGSGVYFYRFRTGDVTQTRKMVLLK